MLISEGNSQKIQAAEQENQLTDYMEKAELFSDIFTSVKACFWNSAHICLLEAGLQETWSLEQLKNVELKYRMPDQIGLKVLEVLTAGNTRLLSSIKNHGNQEGSSTACRLERQTLCS